MSGKGKPNPNWREPIGFDAWRRRGLANSLAKRAAMPKCGARRRTDGEPCRQPVAEEGKRCRYHGGATPKGRDWHRVQLPAPGASPQAAIIIPH